MIIVAFLLECYKLPNREFGSPCTVFEFGFPDFYGFGKTEHKGLVVCSFEIPNLYCFDRIPGYYFGNDVVLEFDKSFDLSNLYLTDAKLIRINDISLV